MTLKTVTIIGLGNWGKRVASILNLSEKYNTETISSREILKNHLSINRPKNIVWITSPPPFQYEILELIQAKRVIVEKPFLSNRFEYEKWQSKIQPNLFMSLPWNYSDIWLEIKNFLHSEREWKIEIQRKGPVRRSYLSPIADWLPHDLGLISDVSMNARIEILQGINLENDFGSLKMNFNTDNIIEWHGGYSLEKLGVWKIENKQKSVLFDFMNRNSIMQFREGKPKMRNYIDNPILTMLTKIDDDDPNCKMNIQFDFYKKIFSTNMI